jgi:hypothetical protein
VGEEDGLEQERVGVGGAIARQRGHGGEGVAEALLAEEVERGAQVGSRHR